LESLTQKELVSRLTLNCTVNETFKPANLPLDQKKISILDAMDEVAIPEKLREELYKLYPDAKVMQLKTGGNFPYLSRADEFNLYLQVRFEKGVS
jgi:maspardin